MNICSSEYNTKIFCSHPASEFKDPTQLLSNNSKLENGYLAESFVKPPVFILVTWSSQYKVNRISFKPSYGRHMINKMSIRFIPKNSTISSINHENFKGIIDQYQFTKPDLFLDLSSHKESQTVEINFVSEHRQTNEKLCIFNLIRRNIVSVLFQIIAMKNTSLPCLSNLRIFSAVKRKPVEYQEITSLNINETISNNYTERLPEDYNVYPDDCLDPLTSEILNNPVLLPCGKYVNLDSLIKFWASKPKTSPKYNPFTMVPLTDVQIHSSMTIDIAKKQQVSHKIQEFRKKKEDLYQSILHPKKKYESKTSNGEESDSDEEYLATKLNENIAKYFPFLLNKSL